MFDELFPILSTRDIKQALAFYRDLLGAIVTYRTAIVADPDGNQLIIGRRAVSGG
jgi:catechol 2,3-dioxygenase-like lactoylglutathione lyase family enzyme